MAHLPSFPAYPRTQTGTGRAVRPTPNDRRIHSQTCAQLYAYGDASSVRSEAIDQRRSVCRARALSQLWRRPTVPSRPPLPFLLLSSPLLILPARERRLDARPFTGDWTFLSSFPPLDVGQASGGRGEGGRRRKEKPARASSNSGVQISSSAFRVRIISSIVCLHWKLRGANALICVHEIEASLSFWDSLWIMGSHPSQGAPDMFGSLSLCLPKSEYEILPIILTMSLKWRRDKRHS